MQQCTHKCMHTCMNAHTDTSSHLMTAHHQLQTIVCQELFGDVRAKLQSYTALAHLPPLLRSWVTPEAFTHQPLIRWLPAGRGGGVAVAAGCYCVLKGGGGRAGGARLARQGVCMQPLQPPVQPLYPVLQRSLFDRQAGGQAGRHPSAAVPHLLRSTLRRSSSVTPSWLKRPPCSTSTRPDST